MIVTSGFFLKVTLWIPKFLVRNYEYAMPMIRIEEQRESLSGEHIVSKF